MAELKLCVNCDYIRDSVSGYECGHPHYRDPVTGRHHELCTIARKTACGPEANFFKAKMPQLKKPSLYETTLAWLRGIL